MEAACCDLEGRTLNSLGQPGEGRKLLERSRSLHEQLIRDNPAYTVATTADGPTEYRRGLADILGSLSGDYIDEGLSDESMRIAEERKAVLEALASGPFATDTDRRELGNACVGNGRTLVLSGNGVAGVRDVKRGVAIMRRLVEDSPASATDRIELASALSNLGLSYGEVVDRAGTRRSCLESLSILRSLTPEQRETSRAVLAEISDESWLTESYLASGQFAEARASAMRAASVAERWVEGQP